MTKTTKAILRISPLGIVASAILFAGCVAPAGAVGGKDLTDFRQEREAVQAVGAKDLTDFRQEREAAQVANTMSDAARQAWRSVSSAPNVAATGSTMSDAAREAWRSVSTARSVGGDAAFNAWPDLAKLHI